MSLYCRPNEDVGERLVKLERVIRRWDRKGVMCGSDVNASLRGGMSR